MLSNAQTSVLAQLPQIDINRSQFDRSFKHLTTLDSGYLVPILRDEILPGDTIDIGTTLFARLATQIVPFMDNAYVDFHLWFVPRRLTWSHWQNFMGEQDNPTDSVDYLVPTVTVPQNGCSAESMLDYLGVRPETDNLTIDAQYPRSCNLIYNKFYRDENLQTSLPCPTGDGPDDPDYYQLFKRGKRGDYFTMCVPSPQKFGAVNIPLGSSAPVIGNGNTLGLTSYDSTNSKLADGGLLQQYNSGWSGAKIMQALSPSALGKEVDNTLYTQSGDSIHGTSGQVLGVGVSTNADNSGLICDLSNAIAPTINTLRAAVATQQWLERSMMYGTRYPEILLGHFGVRDLSLAVLQQPEFLGSFSAYLNQMTVAQTSSTDNTSPQGNLAAYSMFSAEQQQHIVHSFTEHGILIGFVSIRADQTYQYGLDRQLTRRTRFDFFFPEFQHLGMQAVKKREIFAAGTDDDDDIWGYNMMYDEYRTKNNMITGKLRSGVTGSLDVWHLAQAWNTAPELNSDFIEENPPFDRVIAVQNEPQFILEAQFDYWHTRPMAVFGMPGLKLF